MPDATRRDFLRGSAALGLGLTAGAAGRAVAANDKIAVVAVVVGVDVDPDPLARGVRPQRVDAQDGIRPGPAEVVREACEGEVAVLRSRSRAGTLPRLAVADVIAPAPVGAVDKPGHRQDGEILIPRCPRGPVTAHILTDCRRPHRTFPPQHPRYETGLGLPTTGGGGPRAVPGDDNQQPTRWGVSRRGRRGGGGLPRSRPPARRAGATRAAGTGGRE